ncbi:MAG: hypothetical protein C0399_07235 [Syntrophus sp. (in: bacteria)]|nr:hypothetical protein [Syntrophus sp. (in: bacteria)]
MGDLCKLCGNKAELRKSHILPEFAFGWLKETGATKYLRVGDAPNKRVQDGHKMPLLCQACETLFSKDENEFARVIFRPYVGDGLDANGEGTGAIPEFIYKEWLLRFIISVHWRVLVSEGTTNIPIQYWPTLKIFEETWRHFLLRLRPDTGICETHIVFLSSVAAAKGGGLLHLGENVNYYILRTVDKTLVISDTKRKYLAVYSKLGPIAFFTAIMPSSLKGTADSKVRMRGSIKIAQKLNNSGLNRFILVTRPNEVKGIYEISERQNEKILKDMTMNPEQTLNSLSSRAFIADKWLERLKKN